MSVVIKRVYDKPVARDGYRVLVDGLWPRGFSKEALRIHTWMRGIAPSTRLRNWYGHQPERWEEFRERYRKELSQPPRQELLDQLVKRAGKQRVTLVFAARDADHSNAAVIAELMREAIERIP